MGGELTGQLTASDHSQEDLVLNSVTNRIPGPPFIWGGQMEYVIIKFPYMVRHEPENKIIFKIKI